jgi:hypothetical protein
MLVALIISENVFSFNRSTLHGTPRASLGPASWHTHKKPLNFHARMPDGLAHCLPKEERRIRFFLCACRRMHGLCDWFVG